VINCWYAEGCKTWGGYRKCMPEEKAGSDQKQIIKTLYPMLSSGLSVLLIFTFST
jgi:hypothetical protein